MEKQQKKTIKKVVSWCLIAVIVILLAIMPLLASNQEEADTYQASILSGTVQTGDISTSLIGGGKLTVEEPVEITIPAAVKLVRYLVENGQTVAEGDPVATVDRVTVMTAITQVQDVLETLAEEIEDIQNDTMPESIVTQAGGQVKILYVQEGDSVVDVMLEHGALAVLSLDGLMKVEILRTTALPVGQRVCVTLPDDREVEGIVESNLDGVLTVIIEDDNYTVGETVRVTTEDGDRVGSGELEIHNPWNAVAWSGTVSGVHIGEGSIVSSGKKLFTLKDTGHTGEYLSLTQLHREYQQLMLELFRMYQTETIYAPGDGMITGVDEKGAYMLREDGSAWELTLLTNAPNGDDETGYVNFVGQVVSVGIDGLVLRMNPQQLHIADYKDLSGVPLDSACMTESVLYSANAPVYTLSGEDWVQIGMSDITAGDILLFAGDGSGGFVWVVRVVKGTPEPEPESPTTPETPTDPSVPGDATEPSVPEGSTEPTQPGSGTETQPEDTTTPTQPTIPSIPTIPSTGGNIQFGGGNYGGFGGMLPESAEEERYSLDTVTIASVTPQENVTVEISVDELDISKVYLGQTACVTLEALPGEVFEGMVTAISGDGTNLGGNSKFSVELTMVKGENMLPGMSASVVITLETQTSVLTVPVAALTELGQETVLYTGYDEKTGELGNPVAVTVGVSDGENAQILSGMAVGETYYYAYYDTLVISNVAENNEFSFGG